MLSMDILRKRSSGATCGVMEREVIVPSHNVSKAIKIIKESGSHMFIGSGPAGKGKTKLWFIVRGGF